MRLTFNRSLNTPARLLRVAVPTALATLAIASTASAHPVAHLVYDGPINGGDAVGVGSPSFPAGEGIAKLAVDQSSNSLYVASQEAGGRLYKFNALTRQSSPFSELAPNTVITGQPTSNTSGLAVDNSGTETQGSIYAWGEFQDPNRYLPGGTEIPSVIHNAGADDCGGAVAPDGHIWVADFQFGIREYLPDGTPTGSVIHPQLGPYGEEEMCDFQMDSKGNFYVTESWQGGFIKKYSPTGAPLYRLGNGSSISVAVDRSNDSVFVDDKNVVEHYSSSGALLDKFGLPEGSFGGLSGSYGIAVDESTQDVFVGNQSSGEVAVFAPGTPKTAADVSTDPPTPAHESAVLHGTINPDGVATTKCYFEWGLTESYGHEAACAEGNVFTGSSDLRVSAEIFGLTLGSSYHARLVVENEESTVSPGQDRVFTAQDKPSFARVFVDSLDSSQAGLNATIVPNQGRTTYRFEYGTDTSYGTTLPSPEGELASRTTTETVRIGLEGLTPGQTYHFRVIATNEAGVTESEDYEFKPFAQPAFLEDKCPNALSRQQTGAALLPDCRSYELASAEETGGYNVESDLVPGQEPFAGYPSVDGRLLYGTHNGGVPGSGSPTNRGVDPYLAVRGEQGWTTKYVGVPADGTPSTVPFSSTLFAADEGLSEFAFGGPEICSPCFTDGTSGIPVRDRAGSLVQGMAGDLEPSGAKSDGLVRQPMSGDGSHLVFGSTSRFEPDGNNSTGDVSIYDRDLDTGVTQVVSKNPSGSNLQCLQGAGQCHSPGDGHGIAELAISKDGRRIVVGQLVGTDAAGNEYWHPYLYVGSDPHTIDLAPGTTSGVLFDGMTEDGSRVFMTTRDKLSGEDTDSSADIYVDEIAGSGPVTPKLVSVNSDGSPSNTDACAPVAEWNTVSGGPNCDAAALAGGGGLASHSGTFYFISPEQLDGSKGAANQVNLYVVEPGGTPRFVATMDSSVGKPGPPPPSRPIINRTFLSGLSSPQSMAVNQSTGDIYVQERGTQQFSRFTSAGAPDPFTEGPGAGTNSIPDAIGFPPTSQIAVDNHAGSPFENDVYATGGPEGLGVYSNTGALLGSLGSYCGVSVDQSTGDIYVGDFQSSVWKLHPVSNSLPVTEADYTKTRVRTIGLHPCQTGVDSGGHVYAEDRGSTELLEAFEGSVFAPDPGPEVLGEIISLDSSAINTDPSTNELFVDTGRRIKVFGPLLELREELAKGEIASSAGVAVNSGNHHVYAVDGSSVVEIGYVVHPAEPINDPAVLHAVHKAGVRDTADFDVTSDGHFAVFPSAVSLASKFDSDGHLEVYRYDTKTRAIDCASCPPTHSAATRDASLASHGNSLTDDGRVLFDSTEPLVLPDTNGTQDVYEWENGEVSLISAGTSPAPSSLLSVTADGKDAYFFTSESLAPQDRNGSLVRIYDAREDGGFFVIPESPPCAASDECHGPGSKAASTPPIASLGGSEGNVPSSPGVPSCKKGFLRMHGKCVKRHGGKPHHHRRRHSHRRGVH